jgi:hypothetical protein
VTILKEELSVSKILRIHGKKFSQVKRQFSDGYDGRCAIGVIMSYYGWDGKDDSDAPKRLSFALFALENAGVSGKLIIKFNDSGATFDEIADYLDQTKGCRFG